MNEDLSLDWKELGFAYHKTDYNLRCTFSSGEWGEIEVHTDETLNLHMAAGCLHYGQQAFEGQKAFMGKDGKVRLFRIDDNARRMQNSARGIKMEPIPLELFREMAIKAVQLNARFIPPYGSDASLYLRPLEVGTTPLVGVRPADDFLFVLFTTPVGAYFKDGFKPTKVVVYREFDRAAPLGTGCWKVGGNYACGMRATTKAKENGFSAALFLDPKEKRYIDECGPANFFGIRDGAYITPKSGSILPSITNMSLQQIARDMGLRVECRPVELEELATFEEAAECGTAAVATPLSEVYDEANDRSYCFASNGQPGPVTTELYRRLRGIQLGELPDTYGWTTVVDI
mgnify:CR=1 FL=1